MINVGLGEQTMVGVGVGLANGGRIPLVSAAACFLTGRALEQDIAFTGFNVKLVGVACGELGPTHHSIEDFSWLRPLVPLIVITPASPCEVEQAIRRAAAHDGAVCNRLSSMPVAGAELTAAAAHRTL